MARQSSASSEATRSESTEEMKREYWRANVRVIVGSLIIWALVSFGFGIILRPLISGIEFGGTDLGFWFAQQGSILVFIALIFNYARVMNKLDRQYNLDEQ
jgi:putative solute:sodium symporter small subunit